MLRLSRVAAGHSQGTLAAACGCSRSRIQRIESGRGYVVLTEDLAARIAAAVGVAVETLFGTGPGGCS